MAAPALNALNYLQVGLESVYGTPVACTHRLPVLDWGFPSNEGLANDDSQIGVAFPNAPIPTVHRADWFVEAIADFENQLLLWDLAFGTATFGVKGAVDAGAGPYTHTYNDSKALFNSITIEGIGGNVPAGKCERMAGAKVARVRFWSPGPDQPFRVRFEGPAYKKERNQTPTGALTAGTRYPMGWRHITALSNGSADAAGDQAITSFEFTMETPLAVEHTGKSARYVDEPILNGVRIARLSLDQRRHTKTLEDHYDAGTKTLTPALTLTDSTRAFAFTCGAAMLTEMPDPASHDGYGIAMQSLRYLLLSGGSYATQIVITNSEATATTP